MKKICIYGGKGAVYPFLGLLCMKFQNSHAKGAAKKNAKAFFHSPELCMALTVASRHYVPKAPVRLHKAIPALLTTHC